VQGISTKYINEVMIALIVVTGIALISSTILMVSGAKKIVAAYSEFAAVPISVPLLSMQIEHYTAPQYTQIQQLLKLPTTIKVDAAADKLIISSADINSENQWRNAVSEALALDRNLRTKKVCGSVTGACSGAALVAELVGEHKSILIKE
jgi:hypothetical protein